MNFLDSRHLAAVTILLVGFLCLPLNAQAQSAPPASAPAANSAAPQTPARRLMGEVAPKLAELTDNVLFADVWARLSFHGATEVLSPSVRLLP